MSQKEGQENEPLTVVGNQHGDDKTIDSNDTSHDDGNN